MDSMEGYYSKYYENYDRSKFNYYLNLIRCVKSDNYTEEYKELEPFKYNLKMIFNECPYMENELDNNYGYFQRFIDRCITFVKAMGDKKIDYRLILTLYKVDTLTDHIDWLLNFLMSIYVPDLFMQSFGNYLSVINRIFIYTEDYWSQNKIDTGYPFMDEVYRYLKKLSKIVKRPYYEKKLIQNNEGIVSVIIAAVNYYKYYKNNENIYDFTYYMDNLDYYIEKLNMNCINDNDIKVYSDDRLKYVFDNFEALFGKEKMIIK